LEWCRAGHLAVELLGFGFGAELAEDDAGEQLRIAGQ
jgi:hypothetical protein